MVKPNLISSMANTQAKQFEYSDLQTLLRFGNAHLRETEFMLLEISNPLAASRWLAKQNFANAEISTPRPKQLMQIAFTAQGLEKLGLNAEIIEQFSDEFISGMANDNNRSRRLGDVGDNAPENWQWGARNKQSLHVILLLYSRKSQMIKLRNTLQSKGFAQAFKLLHILPTTSLSRFEPFGFTDGISQPEIDWSREQSTDTHHRDHYSNVLSAGEIVLGYPNEYGYYTDRPLINPQQDAHAAKLPSAEDKPELKDLGRNGTYLVLRQLQQDVSGFWRFMDQRCNQDPQKREQLATKMVGRQRDGTPLESRTTRPISGTDLDKNPTNNFTYALDPDGHKCPVGAHIRRANPRTGDYPADVSGFASRIVRALGFGQQRPDEDLVASSRFHRLLRRGRAYGPALTPEQAIEKHTSTDKHGLQFICLVANISRQFEFVQNAWLASSQFASVQNEGDPLIGDRAPLLNNTLTNNFYQHKPTGLTQKTQNIPQFVTVKGGAYFFMPGLRALNYIAAVAGQKEAS